MVGGGEKCVGEGGHDGVGKGDYVQSVGIDGFDLQLQELGSDRRYYEVAGSVPPYSESS